MPKTPDLTNSDLIAEQADAWFLRLLSGNVSSEEWREFEHWRQADPRHVEAYERTRVLWEALELPAHRVFNRIKAEGLIEDKIDVADNMLPRHTVDYPEAQGFFACHRIKFFVAAGCLTILMILGIQYLPIWIQNFRSDYYTVAGQNRMVSLVDGSRLTLNTNTAIRVLFSNRQRVIQLLRGEAFFAVAADKNRPFVVVSGEVETRAVGTAFSIRKWSDHMRVSVQEGMVTVTSEAESIRVPATQQVDYRHGQLQAVHNLDIDDAFAWRRGQIVFIRKPLGWVLDEMNRYRPGHIVAVNPNLADRVVSGVFASGDADAVVAALTATLHAKAITLPGSLVLLY